MLRKLTEAKLEPVRQHNNSNLTKHNTILPPENQEHNQLNTSLHKQRYENQ